MKREITEAIKSFVQQFEYSIDSGMLYEVHLFLNESKEIKSFSLDYAKDIPIYAIKIELTNSTQYNARQLIKSFINNIEYRSMTLYTSDWNKDNIHYTVYTVMNSGNGAHFEIDIKIEGNAKNLSKSSME
ncbi:hypothetical protein [Tengunoibacter tsumagoiensis]|uniref:Uncharacterized protein n=1 Tax=Tengunoibacter tsumagoiensis TaxID=2014871 RepID=A0A402A4Q8_9CHLR|nr:hypothetical protein [Tengunoibacter tsumagoiensis]GCE14144.1 hypothetical protein KTT_40030 [Tengunoibacter tsumagoiensis]